MLGGDHHRVHAGGLAVVVIFHRDLRLAVGTEIVDKALLAHVGELLGHLVREGNRQRHQLGCLVAGVAEHHALIAGAVVQLVVAGLLGFQGLVHAQRDIAGLLIDVGDDGAGVAVKAIGGVVVADVTDHLAGDLGNIHIAGGGDLAHNVDKARGSGGLAGHAAIGILLENGVQNGVADLVADLIGMSLGNRFGSKQMLCHDFVLLSFPEIRNKKAPCLNRQSAELSCPFLIFRFTSDLAP